MIVSAIEEYRKTYLTGNVGPDAFPDLLSGQATTHPGLEDGWKSDDWLRHILTMGDSPKEIAFKYGYIAHAASDFWAHTYVNAYSGGKFDLSNEDNNVELRHIILESYISQHTPPLVDFASQSLGAYYKNISANDDIPFESIANALLLNSDVQAEYSKTSATAYMNALVSIGNLVDQYIDITRSKRAPVDKSIENIVSEINKIELQIDDILSDPTLNFGLICELKCTETDTVCKERALILIGIGPCISYETVCVLQEEICEESNTLGSLREKLIPLRDYQSALVASRPEIELLYQSLLDWREGIKTAIVEYQRTSSQIAIELLKENGNPIQKLKDWISCYGLTLSGVNTVFVGTTSITWNAECKIYKSYTDIVEIMDSLLADHGEILLGIFGNDLYELKNKIEQDIAENLGDYFIAKTASEEVIELVNAYKETKNGDIGELMSIQFSSSGSGDLLSIPDIESRVTSEMHITNGYFNPDTFAVAYNSVILAKLALLDSKELNRMINESGGHTGLYGEDLFKYTEPFNILLGGVKSIDGDYQWLEIAPPYLKSNGAWSYNTDIQTGYSINEGKGFRLYQDSLTRQNIFKKIFKGPIVPGIELPSKIGHEDLKKYDYPYLVCNSNSYPNGSGDRSCVLEYLVPIFSILLH